MALSIAEVLKVHGHIDQDDLAKAFARRYTQNPHRGYAGGAHRLLAHVARGEDWRDISPKLFGKNTVPFCLWSATHHLESFEAAPGYLGTEPLRDPSRPLRYLTIDRRRSLAA